MAVARWGPFAAILLPACAAQNVENGAGARTRTFVGIVQVTTPARAGDLAAVDIKTLGLGWDAGPWLGWRAGSWISADPAKCQLLVVIRATAEAANAAQVLQTLKGKDLCVADYTHTLRPQSLR
jgi:hypothetical protein